MWRTLVVSFCMFIKGLTFFFPSCIFCSYFYKCSLSVSIILVNQNRGVVNPLFTDLVNYTDQKCTTPFLIHTVFWTQFQVAQIVKVSFVPMRRRQWGMTVHLSGKQFLKKQLSTKKMRQHSSPSRLLIATDSGFDKNR